ncbi:hypothetical protein [Corynebacterium sp. 21KM1197]|uniref:hypothetical protein n=1 Tax=Corynebacterium sp. 21KM1197 TaxID=2989734 RepID=UPI0029CA60AC|nr:hypothetical protein [Corynebacterium sp. 21KM1197]WPF68620.1 hypothetical protein OLW90_11365 [Corynebacterium sp. 21KM1197]
MNRWAAAHEAYSTNWQWLAENEARNPAHELPHLPALPKRRWWVVWVVAVALFFLAATLGNNMSVV